MRDVLMKRPFTDAGLSPDLTLGELEDQMGRILRGKKSVLPLEVFQELTGLARMDEWAEAVIIDMLEGFGFGSCAAVGGAHTGTPRTGAIQRYGRTPTPPERRTC